MSALVLKWCEGSGSGHVDAGTVMCQMCGRWFAGDATPKHERLDILAMLDRSDEDYYRSLSEWEDFCITTWEDASDIVQRLHDTAYETDEARRG